MQKQAKHHPVNKWGESVYEVLFIHHADAQNFTKFIGANMSKFALIGCHKASGSTWAVVYRARKTSPWKGGVV